VKTRDVFFCISSKPHNTNLSIFITSHSLKIECIQALFYSTSRLDVEIFPQGHKYYELLG